MMRSHRAMPDPRAKLIWTVSCALWRAQTHIPRGRRATGWPPSIEEFRIVAEAVARSAGSVLGSTEIGAG